MKTRDYLANHTPVPKGTVTQLFFDAVDRFRDKETLRVIGADLKERGMTYGQVLETVMTFGGALRIAGIQPGDRVAILSENRPEWALTDFGTLCSGVPLVPVHSTLTVPQVAYILEDSGARLVFCSDGEQAEKAVQAAAACARDIRIVTFPVDEASVEATWSWNQFLEMGREEGDGPSEAAFRKAALAIAPEDVATILYTSGTTGNPKGVILTHNNLFSNVTAVGTVIPILDTDKTLSFLPLSHILQRTGDILFFSKGCVITYCRSMQTIAEDLRLARPTKVVAVPRLYEKTYQRVMSQPGLKRFLVRWAREVGEAWADETLAGRKPTWVLRLVYRLAHRLVFRRIHEGVGGRIVFFICGSAPLAPEISKFFYSAGILILEGYGLTETSPVVTAVLPHDVKLGTVGPPIPSTEIRIAEDGEILVRGPQVMKGYFNRPKDTEEAILADGWFRTGDIGEIDEDGHLRITDRKKNLLVTAGGKNIAPAPIEECVKKSSFVDQVVMIGDGRPFPALLVVPDFRSLETWAAGKGVRTRDRSGLLRHPAVQTHLHQEVFRDLGALASYERPKKVGLIREEFTIEGGILTPNLKVKRRVVRDRYGRLIERLYDPANRDRDVFFEED